MALVNRSSRSSAQGQFADRRKWTRCAERSRRAGTLICCRPIAAWPPWHGGGTTVSMPRENHLQPEGTQERRSRRAAAA